MMVASQGTARIARCLRLSSTLLMTLREEAQGSIPQGMRSSQSRAWPVSSFTAIHYLLVCAYLNVPLSFFWSHCVSSPEEHEGTVVHNGRKYVLRSDVMYKVA